MGYCSRGRAHVEGLACAVGIWPLQTPKPQVGYTTIVSRIVPHAAESIDEAFGTRFPNVCYTFSKPFSRCLVHCSLGVWSKILCVHVLPHTHNQCRHLGLESFESIYRLLYIESGFERPLQYKEMRAKVLA